MIVDQPLGLDSCFTLEARLRPLVHHATASSIAWRSIRMDDLLDLDWSDQPKQSTAPPLHASSNASRRATPNPTFDFLSKSASGNGQGPNYYSSGTPPIRADTPRTAPLPVQPRASTPSARPQTPQAPPPPAGTDAFSSLLVLGDGPLGSAKKLSLADQQRQIAENKRKKEEHEKQQFTTHGSFWDNLGSSSTAASSTSHTPVLQEDQARGSAVASTRGSGDLDNLLSPQPVRPTQPSALRQAHTPTPLLAAQPSAEPAEWEDDDTFLTGASQQPSRATASPSDPFDFDSLNGSLNGLAPPRGAEGLKSSSSGARTPLSAFDAEDSGTLGSSRFDDEDDLLGELGRPVQSRAERASVGLSHEKTSRKLNAVTTSLREGARSNAPLNLSSSASCHADHGHGLYPISGSFGICSDFHWSRHPSGCGYPVDVGTQRPRCQPNV